MAEATLTIGGRAHVIPCRTEDVSHFQALGRTLDRHFATAQGASGGASGERTFLFLALILADALDEAHRAPSTERDTAALARVAERLEAVAAALEDHDANA